MADHNLAYDGYHRAVELWRRETASAWGVMMVNEINAGTVEAARARFRRAGRSAPSYTAFVIKATAQAIAEKKATEPTLNAYLKNFLGFKKIHCFEDVSCGFSKAAVVEGQEIVLPGRVSSPQAKSLGAITAELKEQSSGKDKKRLKEVLMFYRMPGLLQKLLLWVGAYFPKLRADTRGSYSFTSVGHLGVDWHGLPQSSALQFGMGQVRDRVFAVNGQPKVAKGFDLMCSFDRRFMSGKPAAELLARIRHILEHEAATDAFVGESFPVDTSGNIPAFYAATAQKPAPRSFEGGVYQ